uniref:Cnidarian restricted protein n=1 Tax=Clytia hemisphaerica TaxID=252671 RepID=A0A7M5WXU4_9CNID
MEVGRRSKMTFSQYVLFSFLLFWCIVDINAYSKTFCQGTVERTAKTVGCITSTKHYHHKTEGTKWSTFAMSCTIPQLKKFTDNRGKCLTYNPDDGNELSGETTAVTRYPDEVEEILQEQKV